jgi:hypothetical protein
MDRQNTLDEDVNGDGAWDTADCVSYVSEDLDCVGCVEEVELAFDPVTQAELNAGFVGIGTSAPQGELHVNGTFIEGSGQGTISHGVASFFNGPENDDYIHIRLPFNPTQSSDMFHIRVTGHAYRAPVKVVDITFVGYVYEATGTIKAEEIYNVNGGHEPAIYLGDDDHAYLRIRPGDNYYLTLRVDSMYVGNGRILQPGDVTIELSPELTLPGRAGGGWSGPGGQGGGPLSP